MENSTQQPLQTSKIASKTPLIIIGVLVLALGAAALMYFANAGTENNTDQQVANKKLSPSEEPVATSTPTPLPSLTVSPGVSPSVSPSVSPTAMSVKYKDGSFTATGNYTSPAGAEQVEIKLTLDDGVVKDAVFTGKATHPTSKALQQKFSDGFKQVVVGKNIDSIALTVVNGSSLAPKGFMDALDKIKDQAEI